MEENKKIGFLYSTKIVIVILLITKIIGFAKQVIIARLYGSTFDTDIYNIAYGFINSTGYAIFSALSVTFLITYNEKKIKEKTDDYVINVISIFSMIILCLIIFLITFSKNIALLITKGYSLTEITMVSKYIKIFTVILFFYGLNTILNSVLEANKNFKYSKSFGIILSSFTIIFSFLFSKTLGIDALVIGTVLAYIFYTVILIVNTRKYKIWKNPKNIINKDIRKLIYLIFPLLIGNGIYEINKLVDRYLASGLEIGTVTSLSFSQVFLDSTGALLISSILTVFFSYLSLEIINKNTKNIIQNIRYTIISLLYLILPISIIFFMLGEQLVQVLFQHGKFSNEASRQTAYILKGYSIGLPFLIIRETLLKCHYAYKNTKSPMVNSTIAVVLNIISSIFLCKLYGAIGISLGTSISYFTSSLLLIKSLRKIIPEFQWSSILKIIVKLITSTIIAGIIYNYMNISIINIYIKIILSCILIFIIYNFIFFILNLKNFNIFYKEFKKTKNFKEGMKKVWK